MLKKDFEARHGRIPTRDAVIDYLPDTLIKYNLQSDSQPAHIWHIVQNMPGSHFSILDLEGVRTIFENLRYEQRKPVRDYYLGILDHRFFSSGWGWFSRGGRGLSTFTREIKDIPAEERALALKVLRTLRNGFDNNRYKPKYGTKKRINYYISAYGGAVNSSKKSYEDAKVKLMLADKLPRKKKKEIKKIGLWSMFKQSKLR